MGFYYRIFQNELGRSNTGHPSELAPELTEYSCPEKREIRTICAIWCNILEQNLEFFRRAEKENIQVTLIAYRGNINEPYGLRKFYSIGNISSCEGMKKIIPLSDIDY